MWLLIVALFGLLVPNGLFIYWLGCEHHGLDDVLGNHLALAFMMEAFVVLFLMAYYFARDPPGNIKWYWFIVLSLIGGLGFGIPFYWWLNKRDVSKTVIYG
jgi:hypothetical protein